MTGPEWNILFCFSRISMSVSGNIEILRKQNELFTEGLVFMWFVIKLETH